MEPLVSVVIPTYNRGRYICDAVDSVLAQTYESIEVIVVDDGSTDNTRDILRRYGSKIRYVFQNNAGPSAARNNGIKKASGDLIAFLDSDDVWLPEKLERQVQLIRRSHNVGLVNCGYYGIDASGRIITGPRIRNNYKKKKKFLKELMVHNIICSGVSGSLIRKECFEKLGLFCEDMWIGEDLDMWIRIAKHYDIVFVEEPLVKCRFHESNLCNNISNIARRKEDLKKLVARNTEKWRFMARGKMYSYGYISLARIYMAAGNRHRALISILKSIVFYPLETYDEDSKYRTLCRCLLPSRLFNLVRKFL